VRRIALSEGLRAGLALSAAVVVLAVLGLHPALTWIPEVPLLAAALVLPLGAFGLAGYRAGRRSRTVQAGALAGSLAGAIAGAVGGLAYVFFGKPMMNIAVGLVLGTFGGAIIGAVAARYAATRG
jgi:hypothetical protein